VEYEDLTPWGKAGPALAGRPLYGYIEYKIAQRLYNVMQEDKGGKSPGWTIFLFIFFIAP